MTVQTQPPQRISTVAALDRYRFRDGPCTAYYQGSTKFFFNPASRSYFWSLGQTDRQVVASGRKVNLRRDLRWVAKRTRKFPRKYSQVAKKIILRRTILYFIG